MSCLFYTGTFSCLCPPFHTTYILLKKEFECKLCWTCDWLSCKPRKWKAASIHSERFTNLIQTSWNNVSGVHYIFTAFTITCTAARSRLASHVMFTISELRWCMLRSQETEMNHLLCIICILIWIVFRWSMLCAFLSLWESLSLSLSLALPPCLYRCHSNVACVCWKKERKRERENTHWPTSLTWQQIIQVWNSTKILLTLHTHTHTFWVSSRRSLTVFGCQIQD